METVIVEITISLTGDTVDFMLPAQIPLHAFMGEMIRKLEQFNPSVMLDKVNPVLYNRENSKILAMDQSLAAAGIQDGAKLTLV